LTSQGEALVEDVAKYMDELVSDARSAARRLAASSTETRNRALTAMADALQDAAASLIQENAKDLQAAAEAQYYIGRCQESIQNLYQAFLSYQETIENYPFSQRIDEIDKSL